MKTFIKREDLQRVIETAIENPSDYNFAIDVDGNIYPGRDTLPKGKEEEKEMKSVA